MDKANAITASHSFGLIATEKGFNIFVGGNGGAKPKHSELLATDVPPAEVIPILDRYLMFYIRTADKLQRTARWLEALPGGIKYLREVVLEDKLGINASLEAQMQELVDSFFDEWAEAISNPTIAAQFKQFANTDEGQEGIEKEEDRAQKRPVYWPKEPAQADFKGLKDRWKSELVWQPLLETSHFAGADEMPNGISASVKRGDTQLAIWRVKGKWFATQQMCPHKRAFVLSDGLVGMDVAEEEAQNGCAEEKAQKDPCTANGNTNSIDQEKKEKKNAPWISCPHHKRNFDLASGECRNDGDLSIATFQVEDREDGMVYIKLPSVEELDAELGTSKWKVRKGEAEGQFKELDAKIHFKGIRGKKPGVKSNVGNTLKKTMQLINSTTNGTGGFGGGCGGGAAVEW